MRSYQERIQRGATADHLLNDPVMQEAVESARQEVLSRFLSQPEFNERAAVVVWATNHALDLIQSELRRTLSDGQIAAETAGRNA